MKEFDLIVIGAGPGGYVAALRAAKLGASVAVVENRQTGGTCLNRGCIPTKNMLHSSGLYHEISAGGVAGVSADGMNFNIDAVLERNKEISTKLSAGIESMFKSAHIELLHGQGTITAPGQVKVTGEQGAELITGKKILVATGSVPARPPIPGLDQEGVLTSDEILAGTGRHFNSIVIIGGGVIGVEFATFFNDIGCKVTVLEGLDRLLPIIDRELGQGLGMIMKKRGVEMALNAMVKSVEKVDGGLKVNYEQKGTAGSVQGEVVLCAIGRKPYFVGAFAPELQPATERGRLVVDANFQTSIPGVYAVGDVSSTVQLAHVASAQGTACVESMFGKGSNTDLNLVPSCIYCRPEIASVGLTEAKAKEDGIPVKVGKGLLGANARNLIINGDRSFMKVVAHAETGVVLGAHFMCEHATEMICELSQAVANKLTVKQLMIAMRPHPTFTETLNEALQDLSAKLG
jgi:dihydrolipoamide dehydrogenase